MRAARTAYLAWSPGFGRNLFIAAVVEIGILALCASVPAVHEVAEDVVSSVQHALLDGAHALKWWSAIATLASACCVVQLILSALSVGCSGLNAALGPLRPAMLVATALLQAGAWHVVLSKKPDQARSVAVGTAIAIVLAFSPELLDLVQNGRRREENHAEHGPKVTLHLAKVSCAVCEAKVRAIAEALPAVARCDVDVDSAEATLTLQSGGAVDVTAATAEAVTALTAGGYPLASTENKGGDGDGDDDDAAACPAPPRRWRFDETTRIGGILGGLLGSSCCAVQLGLNSLATFGLTATAGCAGFNKLLGPLRPYTRAATATYLAIAWARALGRSGSKRQRRALLVSTLVAVALTFMPEALLAAGATALAPPTEGAVSLTLKVGGMGCEACQHAVAGVLIASSGVLDARVRGTDEEGLAELLVHPEWGWNLTEAARRVLDAGFELIGEV